MNGHRPISAFWLIALMLIGLVAGPAAAAPFDRKDREQRQLLVRSDAIEAVAKRHKLEILDSYSTENGTLYLVSVPKGQRAQNKLQSLAMDSEVLDSNEVSLASLPALTLSSVDATAETSADVSLSGKVISPCLAWIDTGGVWSGYAIQQAALNTRLYEGQWIDGYWCGKAITVAVIDTTVDTEHPLLASAIVEGADFTAAALSFETLQTSELGSKTRAIVEADMPSVVAGSGSLSVLDSAAVIMGSPSQEVLDEISSMGAYYGHGTMVAGLIRLTAPAAKIMPLVAFDNDGTGHPLDIVRAVDYAIDNGAHVINMSFSLDQATPELRAAIDRARANGIMTVAAAGNQGESSHIYPAAFEGTIGVAATDNSDQLTSFTNFGLATADLAAPGSGVVTLFPGGLFATGWGTSFSTPLVAGNVALIRSYFNGMNRGAHKKTRTSLLLGTYFYSYLWDDILSSGRLDTFGAVLEARY